MANVARRKGVGRLLIIPERFMLLRKRSCLRFSVVSEGRQGGGGGEGLKLECVYRRRGERRGEGGRRR